MNTAYEILGVKPTATQEEIHEAYSKLQHKYGLFESAANVEYFLQISAAYAFLSNPQTRAALDRNNGHMSPAPQKPDFDYVEYPLRDSGEAPGSVTHTHHHYHHHPREEVSIYTWITLGVCFLSVLSMIVGILLG